MMNVCHMGQGEMDLGAKEDQQHKKEDAHIF